MGCIIGVFYGKWWKTEGSRAPKVVLQPAKSNPAKAKRRSKRRIVLSGRMYYNKGKRRARFNVYSGKKP
jgi:hypothetical protein